MLRNWMVYLRALLATKKGQGMVEYGLIIGVVAIMLVTALVALRNQLISLFNNVVSTLSNGGGT